MFYFSLREGWRCFGNLGVIGLLTLASLTITLTLIGFSLRGYLLVEEWKKGLLGRFEIEAFLAAETDSLAAVEITQQILALPDVGQVKYISPEKAAELFSQQFGVDLYDLIESNPLPSSLVLTLKEEADPANSWAKTADLIAGFDKVEDVVYEGNLLAEVDRFYKTAGMGIGLAVVLTLIVSFVFTILSVQSAIRSKEELIQIITLSGGTRSMARGPFIALGGYYGIISGLTASCIMALLGWFIKVGWGLGSILPAWWIPVWIMGGACFGMIGAGWAAGRRIKKC